MSKCVSVNILRDFLNADLADLADRNGFFSIKLSDLIRQIRQIRVLDF